MIKEVNELKYQNEELRQKVASSDSLNVALAKKKIKSFFQKSQILSTRLMIKKEKENK